MALPFPSIDLGGDNVLVKGIQPAVKPGAKIVTIPASMFSTGGAFARSGTDGNATTVVTTTVYNSSIFVDCNCIAAGISVLNGATAAGNTTVALADSTGKVIAISAATAMAGTGNYQRISFITPVQLFGPGVYYILVQNSAGTAVIQTWGVGSFPTQSSTATLNTAFTFVPATTFTANVGPISALF